MPSFWNLLTNTIRITDRDIQAYYASDNESRQLVNFEQANELIMCLQLIESASLAIHSDLTDDLLGMLPTLILLLKHPLKAVSYLEYVSHLSMC